MPADEGPVTAALIPTMSTFDESKIRRGQPSNAGQFAAKNHSAPASGLTPGSLNIERAQHIHPGVTGIEYSGGNALIHITGDTLNNPGDDRPGYAPVVSGSRVVGEAGREALLTKHEDLVRSVLENRHGIVIDSKDNWNNTQMTLTAPASHAEEALANYARSSELSGGSAHTTYDIWDAIERAEGYGRWEGDTWLRHRPTSDEPFWRDAVQSNDLTSAEVEALNEHLEDPVTREVIADGATTNQVIADSLKPLALAAEREREAAEKTLSAKLGADISVRHGNSGSFVASVRGSVPGGYTYESATDGTVVQHRVNGSVYPSAADIPHRYRKARASAEALEEHVGDAGNYLELYSEAFIRRGRWQLYDNA